MRQPICLRRNLWQFFRYTEREKEREIDRESEGEKEREQYTTQGLSKFVSHSERQKQRVAYSERREVGAERTRYIKAKRSDYQIRHSMRRIDVDRSTTTSRSTSGRRADRAYTAFQGAGRADRSTARGAGGAKIHERRCERSRQVAK